MDFVIRKQFIQNISLTWEDRGGNNLSFSVYFCRFSLEGKNSTLWLNQWACRMSPDWCAGLGESVWGFFQCIFKLLIYLVAKLFYFQTLAFKSRISSSSKWWSFLANIQGLVFFFFSFIAQKHFSIHLHCRKKRFIPKLKIGEITAIYVLCFR